VGSGLVPQPQTHFVGQFSAAKTFLVAAIFTILVSDKNVANELLAVVSE